MWKYKIGTPNKVYARDTRYSITIGKKYDVLDYAWREYPASNATLLNYLIISDQGEEVWVASKLFSTVPVVV